MKTRMKVYSSCHVQNVGKIARDAITACDSRLNVTQRSRYYY